MTVHPSWSENGYGFLRPGLKTGGGNDIFWSEIGSGFVDAGGTPPPKIPRSISPGDQFHSNRRRSEIPAIFPETPPTSPEDTLKAVQYWIKSGYEATIFKVLKEFEMCQMGPQLKMKRARLVGNECLTVSQQKPTSCAPDLGKVLVITLRQG